MVRPKQIKPPFPKSEPIVTIHDRVWYAPTLADPTLFHFPGWGDPLLFGNNHPVFIEYCSGNGDWIVEKAKQNPDKNFLAVEKRFDRARKIWSKIQNNSLSNLVVAFAEAMMLSTNFFPTSSVETIYVNFPDPWPKQRHAKHRLISPLFFEETKRVLTPKGSLIVVTDDEAYSEIFLELSKQQKAFTNPLSPSGYSSPPEDYGTSYFDALFRDQGKPVRYHELTI